MQNRFSLNPLSAASILFFPVSPLIYLFLRQSDEEFYLISSAPNWIVIPSILGVVSLNLIFISGVAPAPANRKRWWLTCLLSPIILLLSWGYFEISRSEAKPIGSEKWAVIELLKYEQCDSKSSCDVNNRETMVGIQFADGSKHLSTSYGESQLAICAKVQILKGIHGHTWMDIKSMIDLKARLGEDGHMSSFDKAKCLSGGHGAANRKQR